MKILYTFDEVKKLNGLWLAMPETTYKVLSEKYGVTRKTIKNWEESNNVPSKYPMRNVKESLIK